MRAKLTKEAVGGVFYDVITYFRDKPGHVLDCPSRLLSLAQFFDAFLNNENRPEFRDKLHRLVFAFILIRA